MLSGGLILREKQQYIDGKRDDETDYHQHDTIRIIILRLLLVLWLCLHLKIRPEFYGDLMLEKPKTKPNRLVALELKKKEEARQAQLKAAREKAQREKQKKITELLNKAESQLQNTQLNAAYKSYQDILKLESTKKKYTWKSRLNANDRSNKPARPPPNPIRRNAVPMLGFNSKITLGISVLPQQPLRCNGSY